MKSHVGTTILGNIATMNCTALKSVNSPQGRGTVLWFKFVVVTMLLSACVSSSPTDILTPVEVPVSSPGVSTAGQFPVIGEAPEPQTKQITREEREAETAELKAAAERAKRQRNTNAKSQYQREVSDLKRAAAESRKQRLEQIKRGEPSS